MADVGKVLEEALALAPDQRARIAHQLIESLDGSAGGEREREVEAIRAALVEGEQSGIAEDSSLEGILAEFRSSQVKRRDWMAPETEPTDEELALVMREARDAAIKWRAISDAWVAARLREASIFAQANARPRRVIKPR